MGERISHGCGVSYKSRKHKYAINNKPDTQTTSLFFCPTDDDQQVTVHGGGGAGQKEGDEGGCVYSNGPRPGIGGEGPPLLTIQWRNYHRHQQASSRTVLLQIGFNDKMQRRRVSKSRNKRLVSCGAIRVWRARDYPTSD